MDITQAYKLVYEFDQENDATTMIEIEHPFKSEPLVSVIVDHEEVGVSVKHKSESVVIEANFGLKGKVILIG